MALKGFKGSLLEIDLSNGKTQVRPLREDLYRRFLGGRALGGFLSLEANLPAADPLGEDNQVFILCGPLSGTLFPGVGKAVVVTRSPLTGIYLDSAIGGSLAHNIKMSGYDGLVIKGSSSEPVYLVIENERVEIRPAAHLWGKGTFASESLLREHHGTAPAVATIGPAGENMVKFACLCSDFYHQAGRGGIGAVLGAKKLKAIVVRGDLPFEIAHPEAFFDYNLDLVRKSMRSQKAQYRIYSGTFATIDLNQHIGIVPVKNFTDGYTDRYAEYNTDALRNRLVKKDLGCFGCPMPCGKATMFEMHGRQYLLGGPEYESLALLGTNLDMSSTDCCYLNWLCDNLGLDTMSTGVVLSCAVEAMESGRLSEVDLGVHCRWGDVDTCSALVESIALRRGVGNLMAEGVAAFSQHFNIEDLAMHVKRLELAAYDPRGTTGYALAMAVADRGGCHRRARPLYVEVQKEGLLYEYEGKSALVARLENERGFYHSLVICDFVPPQWNLTLRDYVKALNLLTGLDYTEADALLVGERIATQNRLFNLRCGVTAKDDSLPERFFSQPLPRGAAAGKVLNRETFAKTVSEYYRLRGWDNEGRPLPATLARLGLEISPVCEC